MIKKLQALKAKKGFTLVELIVVIAIIGVLAAILVPTLLGVVTQSRVTSADSTAKSIRETITEFMTKADTAGYGLKQNASTLVTGDVTVVKDGDGYKWAVTLSDVGSATDASTYLFKQGNGTEVAWGNANTSYTTDEGLDITTEKQGEVLLAKALCERFPDIKAASIRFSLRGNASCVGVVYTADTSDGLSDDGSDVPEFSTTNGDLPTTYEWDGKTEGISKSNGYVVGTAPKVVLGAAAETTT